MSRRWFDAVRVLAVAEAVALLAAGLPRLDREPLALAVVFLIAVWTLRFWGGVPATIALGLLFIDVIFFTATAAISNITHGESLSAVLLPLAITVLSVLGVSAAACAIMFRHHALDWTLFRVLAAACAVLVLAATAGSVFRPTYLSLGGSRAIDLRIHNAAYSANRLRAGGRSVSIALVNDDLFWHSFTIDALKVDALVPVDGHRVLDFSAAPGTYTFYCRIPGHRQAGMVGTLTIP